MYNIWFAENVFISCKTKVVLMPYFSHNHMTVRPVGAVRTNYGIQDFQHAVLHLFFLCVVCSSFMLKLAFSLEASSCVKEVPEYNIWPLVSSASLYVQDPAEAVTAGTSRPSSLPLLPPASPGKYFWSS